jgi:glycosyltransferase involved in cell wall biosynthesis
MTGRILNQTTDVGPFMKPMVIAAIGDVSDLRTWSGIPYSFWRAGVRRGWDVTAARLDLREFRLRRQLWNLRSAVSAGRWGGYQYSTEFLEDAERIVEPAFESRTVISFHHHFPRAESVIRGGGSPIYYLDAVLGAELDGIAYPMSPPAAHEQAVAIERGNLEAADRIFTMARWLKEYLTSKYCIPASKIETVAPGASIDVPDDWRPVDRGKIGAFVLGLVGSDWRRKGLEFMLCVAEIMARANVKARVRVIGAKASDLPKSTLIEAAGFVDKRTDSRRFCELVGSCDLGCLFSKHEAYGVSILEFLRLGVPVAGFLHEGVADTIPPDAGFAFPQGTSVDAVAGSLIEYARNAEQQACLRGRAREWAPFVTWDRCAGEMESILRGGPGAPRFQPWRGLAALTDQVHIP